METNKTTKTDLYKIDPRNIVVVEGFNSRVDFKLEELIESIRDNGVKQPISVIAFKDKDGTEKYRLVDGERRYRATMKLLEEGVEIARIPAIFLPKSLTQEELLLEQLVRNEGKSFTDYEYSIACKKFIDFGLTKSEIAKRLHKNNGQVSYWLSIQDMTPELKEYFKTGKVTYSEYHRMAEAHKDKSGNVDEDGILKELNGAYKVAKAKGKTHVTLADLDIASSKTISYRNSKDIRKGLKLLLDYYKRYTKDGEISIDIDLIDICTRLTNGETIDEIFAKAVLATKQS